MILSDQDILTALKEGRIVIDPAPDHETQLGSCSVDLRLGNVFRVFERSNHGVIDLRESSSLEEIMKEVEVPDGNRFIIHPGDFVLATTTERLTLSDDLLGRIEGRSSLGRLGIIVHGTASVFDPGWDGVPTMELGNLGTMPVALYPGMRICSFTFEELKTPTTNPYAKKKGNKYGGQTSPRASRLGEEMKPTQS